MQSNYINAYFIGIYHDCLKTNYQDFTLDNWSCTNPDNFSKNSENSLYKCKLRPYATWYNYFFGNITAHWSTMGGIFSIDKRDIIQHPKTKYISIAQTVNTHSNPEAGHYIERSWGVIFFPLIHTIKQLENIKTSNNTPMIAHYRLRNQKKRMFKRIRQFARRPHRRPLYSRWK